MNNVHVRFDFVVPIKDIQVIRVEAERPCHIEVPREECKQDRDRKTEPKDSRTKQEVIVAINGSRNPSGGYDRIDGLKPRVRTTIRASRGGKSGTYGVSPDKNNANEYGEKHPTGPNPCAETVEEIRCNSCGDDHGRRKLKTADIVSIVPGGRGEITVKENEEDNDGL